MKLTVRLVSFFISLVVATPSSGDTTAALSRVTAPQLVEKLKGAPVTVLNFWATWCEPCKEEFPEFLRVKKEFEKKGVRLLLVSMDFNSQERAVRAFLVQNKVSFETYLREGGDNEFIQAVLPDWSGVLPTTAFFNRDGKLVKMVQAKIDEKKLKAEINNILKTKEKKP
ncbi:MAG TPA: TlpA disulfide reductase family protein [Bdellovibrionales bacterium]|nr:TlpA disulfide reductase family protein [Bdellovibrionales bacterium]